MDQENEAPQPECDEAPPPGDDSPSEGASQSVVRRSLIISVSGSLVGAFFFPLLMGDIFNRYLEAVGFKHRIGLFMAMAALASTAQILGSWILQKTGWRRLFFFVLLGPPRLIWLAIITVPAWGPQSESGRLSALLALYGLFWVTSGIGGVAWLAWMRDLVPEGYRGRFFAFRVVLITIITSTWSFLAARYIQSLGAGNPESYLPVYVVGSIGGVVDIVLHFWVWHPAMKTKVGSSAGLLKMIRSAAHPGLRKYLVVLIIWCFSTSMGGLTWYHMWRGVGMEIFDVSILGVFGVAVFLCLTPLWGYFVDHYGVKATYLTAMILTVPVPLLLTQAPGRGWTLMYVCVAISNIAWSGLNLAGTNIVFNLSRREDQAMTSAVVAVVAGLVGSVGFLFTEDVLFPALKDLGGRIDGSPLFYVIATYSLVAVLRAISVVLATRLDQPRGEQPAGVVVKLFYTTNPIRALYSMGRFVGVKAGDLVLPKESRDSDHSGRFRMD